MRVRKNLFFSTIIALLIACVAIPVNAQELLSSSYYSNTAIAGTWYSGYGDKYCNMTTSYGQVYGGDVGMYFYETSVGMPKSFVKSNSRTVEFELKENDPGNTNEVARKYIGYFETRTDGIYQPVRYSISYTNCDCIESNSTVELYYRMKVDTISGDSSKNVPSGIAKFKYWIER